mgnify:CR=1 FL=1
MRVGLLHSLIRKEEKLLLEAFRQQGVTPIMLDDRKLTFDLESVPDIDLVVERCINHSRAMHGLRLFESLGIRCINSSDVARICGDKILTSVALKEAGLAQPPIRIAFTEDSALIAIEELGYPVVLKPAVGSCCLLYTSPSPRDLSRYRIQYCA